MFTLITNSRTSLRLLMSTHYISPSRNIMGNCCIFLMIFDPSKYPYLSIPIKVRFIGNTIQ